MDKGKNCRVAEAGTSVFRVSLEQCGHGLSVVGSVVTFSVLRF